MNCLFALQPGAGRAWCYCITGKGLLRLPQQLHSVSHPSCRCLYALLPSKSHKPVSPVSSCYNSKNQRQLTGRMSPGHCNRSTWQDTSGSPEPASEDLRTENQPVLMPTGEERHHRSSQSKVPTLHSAQKQGPESCDQNLVGSCHPGSVFTCSFSHCSTLPLNFIT